MSAQHTPGPWRAVCQPTSSGLPFWGVYGANDGAIVYATLRSADELAANVRIMAAAPELLAALAWFINDIDGTHTVMLDFDANVEAARAAIAKATSEA